MVDLGSVFDPAVLAGLGAAAVASAYLYTMAPAPINAPVDLQNQSVPTSSGSRINALCEDGELIGHTFEDAKTLYQSFRRGVRLAGDGHCLAARTGPNEEYEWLTYNTVLSRSQHVGSGLVAKGIKPKDFVGIFSANCIEWVLTQQGCMSFSMVPVPLYDTLGAEAMEHILKQAELQVVFCDAGKVSTLLQHKTDSSPLRLIVKMSPVTEEEQKSASDVGLELISFSDLEAEGKSAGHPDVAPEPEDLACVCYTSGTTGAPKGAMLTHRNIVAVLAGVFMITKGNYTWDTSTAHLSYLPLAHMFELAVQIAVFTVGGCVGFFRGDVKLLMEDLGELKPTLFPSVPRLLNRVYDKVMDGVNQAGPVKRAIFNLALAMKRREVRRGVLRRDSIWDKLVFNKIQNRLGGNVQVLITGAAPISDTVMDFLRCAMGCVVVQGYGQTECGAGATISTPGDSSLGNVGAPMVANEIKLFPVPEMGYEGGSAGEVCFRGINIFKGYLKDEAKTKETVDEDGWLHSGDVGKWTECGTLAIVDRKKQIFKLAQGEYIAPEKVEMAYQCAPFVGQVFLHGDSLQSACVAIIVPDEITLPRWAEKQNISGSLEELCANDAVHQAILSQVVEHGKKAGLKSFEQAKAIHLHPSPFGVDDDLLTPTFKLKRPQLRKFFSSQIESMYSKL